MMDQEIENHALSQAQPVELHEDTQYSYYEAMQEDPIYFEHMEEEDEVARQASEEMKEELLEENDLKDFARCKEWESATSSINMILKNEYELLIKAEVKEEVELCTLQYHLSEVLDEQKRLDEMTENINVERQEFEEAWHRNLYDRQLIVNEVNTSEKVLDVLQTNYQQVKEQNDLLCKETIVLEIKCDNLLEQYESEVTKWKTAIKGIRINDETTKLTEYKEKCEAETEQQKMKLNELLIEQMKIDHELETIKMETDQLETDIRLNETIEKDLISKSQEQQSLIDSIDLDVLQNEIDRINESERSFLVKINGDIETSEKCLLESEIPISELEKKLSYEKDLTKQFEQNLAQLEQEKTNLILTTNEIKAAIKEVEVKVKEETNLFEKKMKEINDNFLKIDENLNTTNSQKKEKLRTLQEISNKVEEANSILLSIINSEKNLFVELNLVKVNIEKIDEQNKGIEIEIENYVIKLDTLKEKISNQKTALTHEIITRDVNQADYINVIKQYEATIHSFIRRTEDFKNKLEEDRLNALETNIKELNLKLENDRSSLLKLKNEENRLRQFVATKQNICKSLKKNLNHLQSNVKKVALPNYFQCDSDSSDNESIKRLSAGASTPNLFDKLARKD